MKTNGDASTAMRSILIHKMTPVRTAIRKEEIRYRIQMTEILRWLSKKFIIKALEIQLNSLKANKIKIITSGYARSAST